jgi:putative membrane protein
MTVVAAILVAVVAALHVNFLVLEMFLFTTPRGRAVFGTTPEEATQMATLAANQGLYNGFLAAGLVWGLVVDDPVSFQFKLAFLIFVIIAGVYGAATVSRRILVIQAVPAVLAIAAVIAAH